MSNLLEDCYKSTRVSATDNGGEPGWKIKCNFCDFTLGPKNFSSIRALDHAKTHADLLLTVL